MKIECLLGPGKVCTKPLVFWIIIPISCDYLLPSLRRIQNKTLSPQWKSNYKVEIVVSDTQ